MSDYEHLFIMGEGKPVFSFRGNFTLMWQNFVICIFKVMNQCPIVSAISVDVGPYCYPRGKGKSGGLRTVGRNTFSKV